MSKVLIITCLVIQYCFCEQVVPRGSTFIINIIDDATRNHICVGSYIRRYWVLTNAVCAQLAQNSSEPLLIASDVMNDIDGQKRTPVKFIVHPKYDAKMRTNNVAVIEISFPFIPGRDVDLVGFPNAGKKRGPCNLIGWTFHNKNDLYQYQMIMAVKAKRLTSEHCAELVNGKEVSYEYNEEQMLCVWDALCMSEEGAPFMCDGKLCGILSYTTCGFTMIERVKYHSMWIDMVTAKITKRDMSILETRSSKSDSSPALSYCVIAFLTLFLCVIYLLRLIKYYHL